MAITDAGIDLSTYTRIGRYDLPEPTRTTAPANSLLAQEVSAVTYNVDTDTLFVVGDGGTSIVQVSKIGELIDSMTLAPGSSPQGTDFYDPEGLTYVGGGKFVLIEERDRQANLFTYAPGTTLTKSKVQTVKLGTTVGNIGIEGISYDPQTNGFVAVKEITPEGIFQTNIDFAAGTASNGSPTTVNSVNLFDPALAGLADFADVYALSNVSALNGKADSSHLLVLSQESGKIVNIDRNGKIFSSLTIASDAENPLSVPDQQHEGLTVDKNGLLYVVSENGGGDINRPQLWVYAPTATTSTPTPTPVPTLTPAPVPTPTPALANQTLIISEVAPWASGNSPYAADWFEVTNTGTSAVDITGWKIDDNSNSFASAVALNGVSSIAPGQSVVFIETADLATTKAAFQAAWFGGTVPLNLVIGSYTGSGVGLSTGGDEVNLFDKNGNRVTGIGFGPSTTGLSFDNKAGLGATTLPLPLISTLSTAGVNGALLAADKIETGSPGTVKNKVAFSAVAAGDASSNDAILWTRIFDSQTKQSANVNLTAQVSTDPNFGSIASTYQVAARTDGLDHDGTAKVDATGLVSGTKYYYRFQSETGEFSQVGTFKTAIDPNAKAAVRFGFSGDADGLLRPYGSTANFSKLNLDFFGFLGDTIYETASTGSPAAADAVVNPGQALIDYHRKYLENLQPVNDGGFASLQTLYASQGNYTLLDNHELGNKQLINGGAPSVLAPNPGNGTNNTAFDANKTVTFINQTVGFKTLEQAYTDYQPIKEKIVVAPKDPRSNGTQQLYNANQWGQNVLYINTDTRSYRDVRLKTTDANGNVTTTDDTGARANNPERTVLGATQLAWLKQNLLDAQKNGTVWKFVAVGDPIDQLGAIGSGADGGKSWIGGYRAERNEILKFIADNNIKNVVFLSTDDHQNRVNELTYLDNFNDPTSVRVLPNALAIVDGPIGATGPDTITDHSFANIKALADKLAAAQTAAGINPIGLAPNFSGLRKVVREGDPNADTLRQPIDFYSPDTFNYTVFDVSPDGKTLNVNVQGINSAATNSFLEPSAANPVRSILSFSLDAALPVINLAATTPTASETNGTPGGFKVTGVGNNVPLTFNYTLSGTATNGLDYNTLSGTATLESGQTSVEIPITPIDDSLIEGTENVVLTLQEGASYNLDLDKSAATVSILDNEITPVGTAGNDNLIATPGSKFDGRGNTVFTGAGNDIIDVPIGGALVGNNRIDAGSGNDIIYVANGDRAFGGTGDDELDATDANNYRISGGDGNDTFYLGNNGRALGDDGNDKFYVGAGGGNIISGGADNDQFWIYNAEAPTTANTILDFLAGADVIGIQSGGTIKYADLVRSFNNIAIGGNSIATLTGVETSTLTAASFVFI